MYYSKVFLLYSFLGFVMESTLFKIVKANKYSGIFYGPMTAVYGVGVLSIELLNKYLFNKIKINKIIKIIIEYLILTLTLTLIEYLGGNILNSIFDIDMWNYSNKFMNFGKYICLQTSLTWGLLGLGYIYIFKPFTDKIINQITKKETLFFLMVFIIDSIIVIISKA